MQWPEPWEALDESDRFRASSEKALLRELGPGHLLYGVPVQAIARSFAADDVLYDSVEAWLAHQEKETDLEW